MQSSVTPTQLPLASVRTTGEPAHQLEGFSYALSILWFILRMAGLLPRLWKATRQVFGLMEGQQPRASIWVQCEHCHTTG